MIEIGRRKANDTTLFDEDKLRLNQLLDIAKAKKSLAESKRVRSKRTFFNITLELSCI